MAKKKPSRQRLWTKDEVRELRALAKQRLTAAIIARRLKRSLDSTKRKASVLGVPLGAAVRWTKDDLQKLRSLAAKKQPLPTIARALKRTEAAIEKMASNVGISLDMQDCSGCFRLERLPGGTYTHWKAPPLHGAPPKRTFDAHPPDQCAQLRVDLRSPSLWARLPTPVGAKAGPVPTHERLGPDEGEDDKIDGNQRYGWNQRLWFVSRMRPCSLRRKTFN